MFQLVFGTSYAFFQMLVYFFVYKLSYSMNEKEVMICFSCFFSSTKNQTFSRDHYFSTIILKFIFLPVIYWYLFTFNAHLFCDLSYSGDLC